MTRVELLQGMKPVLFNTEMVQAILDGRKTVTRRCIKPQPPDGFYKLGWCMDDISGERTMEFVFMDKPINGIWHEVKGPCKPGDILYVRETWTLEEFYDDEALIRFKAGGNIGIDYECEGDTYSKLLKYADSKWIPSLFMPKEAARIFLKVKDVRVERLQDITEEQAQSEGCNSGMLTGPCTARWQFQELWDSTIKKSELDTYGWEANPYVWVIEFERVYLKA